LLKRVENKRLKREEKRLLERIDKKILKREKNKCFLTIWASTCRPPPLPWP
jgi:hypothetical protein